MSMSHGRFVLVLLGLLLLLWLPLAIAPLDRHDWILENVLLVAAVAYLVMGILWLEHLIFVFPELLLLVIAAALIVGRYTGYRLLELRRFRAFQSEVSTREA